MSLSHGCRIRIHAATPLLLASAWFACLVLVSPAIVRAQQSAPAAAAPSPAAQPPAVTENVLRAQSRVVRVDVIVTDKKGKYVHDLTAKDFHVFRQRQRAAHRQFLFRLGEFFRIARPSLHDSVFR